MKGSSDGTSAIANDRVVGRVQQSGEVNVGKLSVDQLKLVDTKQRRPDGLDLDVGKRLADAPMTTGAEWNVAEFLLAAGSLHAHEPMHSCTPTHSVSMAIFHAR